VTQSVILVSRHCNGLKRFRMRYVAIHQNDLFNVILAPYGIYRNALVTFPENGLTTK